MLLLVAPRPIGIAHILQQDQAHPPVIEWAKATLDKGFCKLLLKVAV
jgi:hypothetical protein